MPIIDIQAGESDPDLRTVTFQLVGTDGITPANGENGGQPQIRLPGGAWTSTGIGTLTLRSNGQYDAVLTTGAVDTAYRIYYTRYKSGNTAECPGDTIRVVNYDPYSAIGLIYQRIIGTTTVIEVTQPLPANNGVTNLSINSSYCASEGRGFDPVVSGIDLTGATILLSVRRNERFTSTEVLSVTVTGSSVTTTEWTLLWDLTNANLRTISQGEHAWTIIATFANSNPVELMYGWFNITTSPE